MNLLVRKLIAKELFLNRALVAGATAAGLAGLLIATTGEVGFNVGFVMWLTALIALGVMLALFGVGNERKERALLFVLSLPLAPADYVRAKLAGLLLCFVLAWVVLSGGALALIAAAPGIPDGLLPYGVLMCVFMLLNFSLVLCAALHIRSEAAMGGVIILTNMSVSLFMMGVTRIPGIAAHMLQPEPTWTPAFWQLLAAEIALTLAALALPLFVAARRQDVV
jgi:ABC-type transport system involved in multi-copper enzyme maturation permease subunit